MEVAGTVTGGSVNLIPDSGAITVGIPTPGAISTAGELDEWSFFGRIGRAVAVRLNPTGAATPGAPGAQLPVLNWGEVTLLGPSDQTLATATATSAGQVLSLNDISLPADGTYKIQFRAAAAQTASTGSYFLAAYDSTADTAALEVRRGCSRSSEPARSCRRRPAERPRGVSWMEPIR